MWRYSTVTDGPELARQRFEMKAVTSPEPAKHFCILGEPRKAGRPEVLPGHLAVSLFEVSSESGFLPFQQIHRLLRHNQTRSSGRVVKPVYEYCWTTPMKPSPKQQTPKQLQRQITKATKIIEEWTARGFGNPTGLQTARDNLHGAQQALEAGHIDMARERFAAAFDYITSMGKDALADWMRRRPGQPKL